MRGELGSQGKRLSREDILKLLVKVFGSPEAIKVISRKVILKELVERKKKELEESTKPIK